MKFSKFLERGCITFRRNSVVFAQNRFYIKYIQTHFISFLISPNPKSASTLSFHFHFSCLSFIIINTNISFNTFVLGNWRRRYIHHLLTFLLSLFSLFYLLHYCLISLFCYMFKLLYLLTFLFSLLFLGKFGPIYKEVYFYILFIILYLLFVHIYKPNFLFVFFGLMKLYESYLCFYILILYHIVLLYMIFIEIFVFLMFVGCWCSYQIGMNPECAANLVFIPNYLVLQPNYSAAIFFTDTVSIYDGITTEHIEQILRTYYGNNLPSKGYIRRKYYGTKFTFQRV